MCSEFNSMTLKRLGKKKKVNNENESKKKKKKMKYQISLDCSSLIR